MKIGLVIPTYNEADNLPKLTSCLLALPLDLCLLIVDDNSPDGTGRLADGLAVSNMGRIEVLHRPERQGLASAYVDGFRHFLESKVDAIAQMDADFSHDPSALVAMAKGLESFDVVCGSRYTHNGSVDTQWSSFRKGLSSWGNLYARIILRIPIHDLTTGYRLWKSETLRGMPLDQILSTGYIFQVEMAYLAHCLEYQMSEYPIHFADRSNGQSKMSLQIQVEAAFRVWQIWLTHRHLCHEGQSARIQRSSAAI